MSIIDRIRRIAKANIHSLLDKADTPEMALEEKIEKLEQTIGNAKEALAGYAVSCKRLEMEQAQSERAVTEWLRKAEIELKSGRESAARNALTHRVRSRERVERLGRISLIMAVPSPASMKRTRSPMAIGSMCSTSRTSWTRCRREVGSAMG